MIVITTPTGQIGHQLLENVLPSGKPVRVIVRDPSRLSSQVRERAEVVEGSHSELNVVTEAFTDAEGVFWLLPPNPQAENVESYYLDFTRPASEAFKSQGVKRVVAISSLGREYGRDAGLLSAAFAMDELIERAGVSYRALCMPFFMENFLNQVEAIKHKGMFFLGNAADRTLATVATRDIAAVAAELMIDDSWSGLDSVSVVGPDDLSPNDMAQTISQVLNRPIRFQEVSGDAQKAMLKQHGMSESFAQAMVDMVAAQNDGVYDAGQRAVQRTPTSFRQWCEEVLKPAVEK